MTKPTGRPRGRPKTKEYVTLMARVDLPLAHRVQRYAALHRQPISVVMRDALALLMDEYSSEPAPHRLAAHEFLADRYDAPLDILMGESDSADREALLSDRQEAMVEAIMSDINADAPPVGPAAMPGASQRQCRKGHPPYPATQRECKHCVADRQRRKREHDKLVRPS